VLSLFLEVLALGLVPVEGRTLHHPTYLTHLWSAQHAVPTLAGDVDLLDEALGARLPATYGDVTVVELELDDTLAVLELQAERLTVSADIFA
jgi:hypothetical protein